MLRNHLSKAPCAMKAVRSSVREGSPKFWRAVLDMHDNRTLQPLVDLVERDLIERKR